MQDRIKNKDHFLGCNGSRRAQSFEGLFAAGAALSIAILLHEISAANAVAVFEDAGGFGNSGGGKGLAANGSVKAGSAGGNDVEVFVGAFLDLKGILGRIGGLRKDDPSGGERREN